MLGSIRSSVLRLALLVLYVLASASLPFAHRPVQAPVSAELAQFVLPDGTLPIICGRSFPGEPAHKHAQRTFCDACCLTSAPGLPPAADVALPVPAPTVSIAPLPDLEIRYAAFVASLGARGPPAI